LRDSLLDLLSLLAGFSIGVAVASVIWYKYGGGKSQEELEERVREYIEELKKKKAALSN